MRSDFLQRFGPEIDEAHEKTRRDVMRTIEAHGSRPMGDLPDMTEGERAKWFFWNLHENLSDFRKLEPTLIGQIMCTQLTVTDGLSMATERMGMEKKIALNCRWHLRLAYSSYQNEEAYSIGEGLVDLSVCNTLPTDPPLQKNQKGYLDNDNSLYPNQLYLFGWVTEPVWNEIKSHLYTPMPNCQTDIVLRDDCVYPVKAGFGFVAGPPGAIGITNMEFRVSSHTVERRSNRRAESLQR
ncbi:hypothetical protein [Noviherbaspirillum aridicola]|uniref:Uncharacterized protein n=1 Tax=Noviherbaspirillum aridicola TaxID=2849687 RepID=A0ABQ4PZU5_9BURK|nr:hypothetical protein [Noviherbaspirillum aridicola]GIZ50020.1 hypothetical protein NCCP691_00340 [Noviherbaspirillum aridicola]